MFVYPYKMGSESAKKISEGLGAKRIKLEGSSFKGDKNKLVVNWGNSTNTKELEKCVMLNHPDKVVSVSNKKLFFEKVQGKVRIPDFTTDYEEAAFWSKGGEQVIGRKILQGSGGVGIKLFKDYQFFSKFSQHNNIKLYTKYCLKKEEYRVHIFCGEVVLVQRKAKKSNLDSGVVNWQIRNHKNGFVFVKNEDREIPGDVINQALLAMEATELDFGAVDVIYNAFRDEATVLEINTAPGLEGSTVDTYIDNLKKLSEYFELLKNQDNVDETSTAEQVYKELVMKNPSDWPAITTPSSTPPPQPMYTFEDGFVDIENDLD